MQGGEEVTFTSAGEPRAKADKMFSVTSLFCYTESTNFYTFSSSMRAFVRIIIGYLPSIGPLASADLTPLSTASSASSAPALSALSAGPISSGAGGSSRSPGKNLGISEAGILRLFVLAQRSQRAGHELVLIKSIGNIKTN